MESKLLRIGQEREIPISALADMSGISESTIRRIETGQITDPKIGALAQLALALHVELLDIVEDDWIAWRPFHTVDRAHPTPPAQGWWKGYYQRTFRAHARGRALRARPADGWRWADPGAEFGRDDA